MNKTATTSDEGAAMTRLEGKLRQLGGIAIIGFFALLIGYVLASGLAQYRYGLPDVNGGVKTGHAAAQNQASGGAPSAMARALPK